MFERFGENKQSVINGVESFAMDKHFPIFDGSNVRAVSEMQLRRRVFRCQPVLPK
jgi:hypothetical protein